MNRKSDYSFKVSGGHQGQKRSKSLDSFWQKTGLAASHAAAACWRNLRGTFLDLRKDLLKKRRTIHLENLILSHGSETTPRSITFKGKTGKKLCKIETIDIGRGVHIFMTLSKTCFLGLAVLTSPISTRKTGFERRLSRRGSYISRAEKRDFGLFSSFFRSFCFSSCVPNQKKVSVWPARLQGQRNPNYFRSFKPAFPGYTWYSLPLYL